MSERRSIDIGKLEEALTLADERAEASILSDDEAANLPLYRALEYQKAVQEQLGSGYKVWAKPGKRGIEFTIKRLA